MKTRTPSYRLHRPSGQAVVTLGGKDRYLGKHGTPDSHAEYDRLIAEWLSRGRRPSDAETPAGLTINEMIVAYWAHAEAHYRDAAGTPTDEIGNIRAALRPLRALYGRSSVRDFGPLALRAVRDEMVKAGLARTSVNARVNRIRRAFKWAASVELAPVAVSLALATVPGLQRGRTAARETDPIGPVAADAIEAVLSLVSRPVAAMIRLQLLTGMRPGEACAMRGRDLAQGDPTWVYSPASHKTAYRGKRRVILLGPRAIEVIRPYLRPDPDAHLFDPREAVAERHARRSDARKSRPTPSERAKRAARPGAEHSPRYSRSSYAYAIVRACDRAFPHPTLAAVGKKVLTPEQAAELLAWRKAHRWHPNQLRHTAATTIHARFGLEAAQVILGHARADVSQVYAARDEAKAQAIMREIG